MGALVTFSNAHNGSAVSQRARIPNNANTMEGHGGHVLPRKKRNSNIFYLNIHCSLTARRQVVNITILRLLRTFGPCTVIAAGGVVSFHLTPKQLCG